MSEGLHIVSTGEPSVETTEQYARRIDNVGLPSAIEPYIEQYESAVGERDRFVWKWVYDQFDRITLPTVSPSAARRVRETKLLLTLYVTTTDDVVERWDDRETFTAARQITRGEEPGETSRPAVVSFLQSVWDEIDERLRAAPRYEEFRELFAFDLRQVWTAVDYSRVFDDCVANADELRRYDTHNMVVFPYAGVDLMHSPSFDRSELGALRALLWQLQVMARIGNWLSTWERELTEGDYASGVVVRAIEQGIVDPASVEEAGSLADAIRDHDVEDQLLAEWERTERIAAMKADRVDCFDASQLVDGMRDVLGHHLASDGLK